MVAVVVVDDDAVVEVVGQWRQIEFFNVFQQEQKLISGRRGLTESEDS